MPGKHKSCHGGCRPVHRRRHTVHACAAARLGRHRARQTTGGCHMDGTSRGGLPTAVGPGVGAERSCPMDTPAGAPVGCATDVTARAPCHTHVTRPSTDRRSAATVPRGHRRPVPCKPGAHGCRWHRPQNRPHSLATMSSFATPGSHQCAERDCGGNPPDD
jgi:hypothetical protein